MLHEYRRSHRSAMLEVLVLSTSPEVPALEGLGSYYCVSYRGLTRLKKGNGAQFLIIFTVLNGIKAEERHIQRLRD